MSTVVHLSATEVRRNGMKLTQLVARGNPIILTHYRSPFALVIPFPFSLEQARQTIVQLVTGAYKLQPEPEPEPEQMDL